MNASRRYPLCVAVLVQCVVATSDTTATAQAQQDAPATPAAQQAAGPAPKERIAAVKKSFMESQATLRKYEWNETTVVSMKDEEKSRKVNRCYYGAEGKLQKVPVTATPEAKPSRGLRGKIKEKKKEELADYMEEAAELLHKYLPPDPEKLQASADAGKVAIAVLEPGKRARLQFADYLVPGDALSVEIDLTNNTILGVSVASYLATEKDAVTLDVKFDKFPDGTIYTAETTLEAKAKNVKVVVENGGYKKLGG